MTIQSKINEMFKKKEVVAPTPKPITPPHATLTRHAPVEKIPVHQHLWKVVGKTYAPPSNMSFSGGQTSISTVSFEKMAFGVTTILWDCVCGETKKEELLGSDEDLLESLIDKADKIGPQFIERRGKTFIVSEWKTPAQSQGMIPLK
jgi:hypothetical protein